MGETFYTILGVDPDATAAQIRRGYRDQVKECHPDVNDAPDANRRFKRLTTARDVLLDDDERARYDRLGHDSYVRRHVDSSAWQPTRQTGWSNSGHAADTESGTGRGQSGSTGGTWSGAQASGFGGSNPGGSTSGTDRTAWGSGSTATGSESAGSGSATAGSESAGSGSATAGSASVGTDSAGHRAGRESTGSGGVSQDGSAGWRESNSWSRVDSSYERGWQRAPDAYMRSDSSVTPEPTPVRDILGSVRQTGHWLFVHLVLLASAVAMSWFLLNRVSSEPVLTAATGLFSLLLVSLVVMLSALHIMTELS